MTAGDSAAGRICGPSSALLAMTNPLSALSPLDGRYAAQAGSLRPHFSEFGLIRSRVRVELAWLAALADEPAIPEVPPFDAPARAAIDEALAAFSPADAGRVILNTRTGGRRLVDQPRGELLPRIC